jgi:hypothetical protein
MVTKNNFALLFTNEKQERENQKKVQQQMHRCIRCKCFMI